MLVAIHLQITIMVHRKFEDLKANSMVNDCYALIGRAQSTFTVINTRVTSEQVEAMGAQGKASPLVYWYK